MQTSRTLTLSLVATLVFGALPTPSTAQTQTTIIRGTATAEAGDPYTDFTVQAREVEQGRMTSAAPLDREGNFILKGLPVYRYMLELIDPQGRVVCTEGPFDVTTDPDRPQLEINLDCGHVPVGFIILGAAAAGGAVAGASVEAPASASR